MATQKLIFSIISILLLSTFSVSVNSDREELSYKTPVGKIVDVAVEGMVYCQNCKYFGTWSLDGAKPISFAKVSVVCKDHKSRVSFYKVFSTDENGYFYGQLRGFTMGHTILDHPLHSCGVHLISSPLSDCSLLSNVNYGINGSPFRYENKRVVGKDYEVVVYTAQPMAFCPADCSQTHY